MFATRHMTAAHVEVLKWLAILTLASLLAALAARLAAGDEAIPPNRLPSSLEQLAKPMTADRATGPATTADPLADPAAQIWQILSRQRNGEYEQVFEEWQVAPLTCEAEVWRHVARGQAALGLRDLTSASEALEMALEMQPQNAVAHYFRGLLRLELAATAGDWYDAIGPSPFRLVSVQIPGEPSLTKSMYRLAARMDFETALEAAGTVEFDEPLSAVQMHPALAVEPTVRDLLFAMRAVDFEGKTHHMLSYLLLDDGVAREAEEHLDQAAALGQHILYGYQDLGQLYEEQHQHLDAVRAYAKALKHGNPLARPMTKILQNLRQAIVEEF
jgi:tetratricopeptide (TPR) repeat protein